MSNTELSRFNASADAVISSLESFQEIVMSADQDHREEFIKATGVESFVAKEAFGAFFDQNIGTEGFKETIVKFFKDLLDKMVSYYNRVREFVISYVGISVKRIERMRDKIKKSSKYDSVSDINTTMSGLYGMGYETEEKSLAYMFLDSPPDRLLYAKFNNLKDISSSISNIIMASNTEEDTVNRIRLAKEVIVKSVINNAVIIKPVISGDSQNLYEKRLSFSEAAAKTAFNEKLNPKEVEIKINAKAFVNGIDGWSKLLKNSNQLIDSSKRSVDTVKSTFNNIKNIDGQSFSKAINEFSSLMTMNVVYTTYIMSAINNYINTTYKIMAVISRHLGISVVRVGAEDMKEITEIPSDASSELHYEVTRDMAPLDEDNQFFAALESVTDEDPKADDDKASDNVKETWEAVLSVGNDKENHIQKELADTLKIIDVCEKSLAIAKTKEVSGTVSINIPAELVADSPYFVGSDNRGEAAVSERLKVIADVADDLRQLLHSDIEIISGKTSIEEAVLKTDQLTKDINVDFEGIAGTYTGKGGIRAQGREYGISLLTVEKNTDSASVSVPVESYSGTNSANITNLLHYLKESHKAIKAACDEFANVTDTAKQHVIEVETISEENTKALKATADDYADAMVAVTALIHAVKSTALTTAQYLQARNDLSSGPSQEAYEKLDYLKNYITASLESGGLLACEVPAINMMSGFLSNAFGLEDFELDEQLFYERSDREASSKTFLDKLTAV